MDKEVGVATHTTSIDLTHNGHGGDYKSSPSSSTWPTHGEAQLVSSSPTTTFEQAKINENTNTNANAIDSTSSPNANPYCDTEHKKSWREKLAYFKTRDFWIILALGQFLALCITGTNTLTTLLFYAGDSFPAFQTFFNYVLLNLIYTSWTLYRYGFKKWGRMVLKDWWKYIILAFFDVEGNYFTVLAYEYTTILSAQLINFWAIVIVVIISFLFLKVRYHYAQVGGIMICVAGMGLLLASDHIQGTNGGDIPGNIQLKGDMFALVGATFYGLSNVYQEWFVSERPIYEVIGQLAFWGMIINGVQAAIFDRDSLATATWSSDVAGYLVGYTLILTLFYSLVPILYRLSSAAFFNISLLTGNFWGVIIGTRVFGLTVYWLYPIAFTLIMIGHFVYYLGKGVLGEAKKAWLGEGQEKGIDGFGTARRKIEMGRGLERGEVGGEGAGIV